MVTDRKIIVSNGNASLDLTAGPFFVNKTKGFDRLDIQNVTSQGFDQDGASLLNSYVLPRDMEIDGQIKASTTAEMEHLHNKMQNIFVPKTTIEINHYYGGRNRLISARVEKTPQIDFTNVTVVHSYNVQLVATDPYWRDPMESLIQVANVRGTFHFPLIIPKSRGVTFGVKSPSLIASVYNSSVIKVGMRVVFIANGTVTNPQLFNIRTRKFFKLLCVMEAGEQIIVETGQEKKVTRQKAGTEEDYIGKVDLAGGGNTFLELDPGDNLFRYAADSGENMLEIKLYYQNCYMGA